MKVVLAAPDRDLLECYRQILQSDFGPVRTAFDGTQVWELLDAETPDLVILDDTIPRIAYRDLAERIRGKGISLLTLTEGEGGAAALSYPFTHEEHAAGIRAAAAKQPQMMAETARTDKAEQPEAMAVAIRTDNEKRPAETAEGGRSDE